jgi:hypothetical protein
MIKKEAYQQMREIAKPIVEVKGKIMLYLGRESITKGVYPNIGFECCSERILFII